MRWFLSPYLLKIKTILICDTSWNSRKSSIRGISAVAQSSNLLWVVPLPLFPLSDSRQMHANYWMAHRLTEKNKEQQQKNDSSANEAFFYSSERLSQLKMAFYCNSRHHQAKAGLPMINMQDKWSPCLSWKVNSESHLRAYSTELIRRRWPYLNLKILTYGLRSYKHQGFLSVHDSLSCFKDFVVYESDAIHLGIKTTTSINSRKKVNLVWKLRQH